MSFGIDAYQNSAGRVRDDDIDYDIDYDEFTRRPLSPDARPGTCSTSCSATRLGELNLVRRASAAYGLT